MAKPNPRVTTWQEPSEALMEREDRAPGSVKVGGKKEAPNFTNILLHSALLTLPMLILSALLLGLIYKHRVVLPSALFPGLQPPGYENEEGVIYVRFSATRLILIASLSSSLAPMLAGSAVALISYLACRHMVTEPRRHGVDYPTSYQLGLVLAMTNGGGIGALWKWIQYLWGWREQRQHQGRVLRLIAATLGAAVLLSILVTAADAWLHATTSSTLLTLLYYERESPLYSFSLTPGCWGESGIGGCSLNPAATNIFLMRSNVSYQVLGNVSTMASVATLEESPPFAFLALPPSEELTRQDYTASTYGMRTQCEAVSSKCGLAAQYGASTAYWCSENFTGNLQSEPFSMPHFVDPGMTQMSGRGNDLQNPYYFGWAYETGSVSVDEDNPEVVRPMHGGSAFVLFCNATLYDVEYDYLNGSISRFVAQMSNSSVAQAAAGPMAATTYAQPYLNQYATTALFSSSVGQMTDKLSLSHSKAAMSFFAQAVDATPALQAQWREQILVARIPTAPLYALVIANLVYVVAGLAIMAVVLSKSNAAVRIIQARLEIAAFVADRFEDEHKMLHVKEVEDLFEEREGLRSRRVGIEKTQEGGLTYEVIPMMTDEDDSSSIELQSLSTFI